MRIPVQIKEADMKEILEIINEIAKEYTTDASKCAYCSHDSEIQELLSEDSLERFRAITKAIGYPLKDFDYEFHQLFDAGDGNEELSILMQTWITLGSSLENALQIFLAIYLSDYKNSGWGKWEEFNYETVKSEIYKALDSVSSSDLADDKRRSLKKLIKEYLKTRKETTQLEKLNLQNLISFYIRYVWSEESCFEELDIIRQYRNCIHSFKKREIGEWDRLLQSLKFYCALLIDLRSRIPDVDDILSYKAELRAEYASYYRGYEYYE